MRRWIETGQHSSRQFQKLLADHGVTCRMSRSAFLGQHGDGALLLLAGTERTARKVYRTRDQARADVFDYIKRFYNLRRRHSTIGDFSPVEFELKAASA